MLGKICTLLGILRAHVVHALSYLMPRDKKLWMYVGWHKHPDRDIFADNAKYAFLYAAQYGAQHGVKAVWLSRNDELPKMLRERGYTAYSIYSLRGALTALRAGVTIVDAFMERDFWQYMGTSTMVQLWHGKGMKKTGYDSNKRKHNRFSLADAPRYATPPSLVASSPHTAKLMSSTFRVPTDKILITGLPRNDVLFNDIKDADLDGHSEFEEKIMAARNAGYEKIIMFAPTFRPDGSNPLDHVDLPAFNAFLEKNNYYLILSLHPKFSAREDTKQLEYSHITKIAAGPDVYPQLKHIDTLVVDYGSLYIDFLLLDRPIIFYTYDLEWYKEASGLHEDFDTLTPGAHPKNFNALLEAVAAPDKFKEKRKEVTKKLFTYPDAEASKRVFESILSVLD